jgi:hypothetical protein
MPECPPRSTEPAGHRPHRRFVPVLVRGLTPDEGTHPPPPAGRPAPLGRRLAGD